MARTVTVSIDANVLLCFFNDEPDKVESCTAFFQLLFTRRIKSVVAIITLLELAAILTAALSRYPSLKIARIHTCQVKQPSKTIF
jgi:predicted nucleic-acid-binding protein